MATSRRVMLHAAAAGAAAMLAAWHLAARLLRQRRLRLRAAAEKREAVLRIAHALEVCVQPITDEVRSGVLTVPEAVEKFWGSAVPDLAGSLLGGPKYVNDNEPEWVLFRRLWYSTMRLLHQPLAPVGKVKYVDFLTGAASDSLPEPPVGTTRFVVVSDTHMRHRDIEVPRGDVLVHCGDVFIMGADLEPEGPPAWQPCLSDFSCWLEEQRSRCPEVLLVGGNHDLGFEELGPRGLRERLPAHTRYLCDSEVLVAGSLRVYGTGYSPPGRSNNRAFQPSTVRQRRRTLRAIPAGLDVLVTHGPPFLHGAAFGQRPPPWDPTAADFGCRELLEAVQDRIRPRVHLFGHVHEVHGAQRLGGTLFIAGSTVSSHLMTAVHPPIVFDLPVRTRESAQEL